MRASVWIGSLVAGATVGLAGCTPESVQGLQLSSLVGMAAVEPGGEKLVAGSFETVAHSAHRGLMTLGFAAEMTQKGEAIHVSSKTSNGGKFVLVFTRDKNGPTNQTHVKLDWESGKDDRLSGLILAQVEMFATQ